MELKNYHLVDSCSSCINCICDVDMDGPMIYSCNMDNTFSTPQAADEILEWIDEHRVDASGKCDSYRNVTATIMDGKAFEMAIAAGKHDLEYVKGNQDAN